MEDDYMAGTFVNPKEDVRPGLQIDRWAKQHRKERRHQELNRLNRQKSHREMEMEHREEALNTALARNNKGFAMLQKMGYKIGQGLGRQSAGITEPIGVNLKAGRGGLGREVAQKEKRHRQEVCRQQETKVSLEEYRKRVRSKMEDRQLESDLRKSQCACQQLDAQAGVNCPVDAWFWVQEKKKEEESEEEEKEDREEDEQSEKDDDDEEEEEEEDDEPNSHEKLAKLTEYLRTRHLYCVWCGTSYDDADDLASNCPGDTAEDHD